ncbi:MAG: saccharopine dehydrogenase NADP-binding domain-containing protein [Nitrospirae bacterium]|nr:saccharopine dehydrogenase NADP-binding domain-containing protein [Nitrospirota bacterium]
MTDRSTRLSAANGAPRSVHPRPAKGNWLIYGANGFTGGMIARRAAKEGLAPTLAGRNSVALQTLASELGLEWRAFDLSDSQTIRRALADCRLVLHCAGPFNQTCKPVCDAAIQSRCHYLDITGEMSVFEYLRTQSDAAARAGVMLLPGVGFDVVPTDCLAGRLKREMPDAVRLELAFVGPNKAASGSVKTALHQLPYGSQVRENGQVKTIPHFSRKRTIHVAGVDYIVYSIPWGDIVTAFHSTAIPNIMVYTGFPKAQELALKWSLPLARVLRNKTAMKVAESVVKLIVPAPSADYFAHARCQIWGEVRNATGRDISASIETPDTYSLTVSTAVLCAKRVLEGSIKPGFQTPSLVFGPEFIFEVGGTVKVDYFGE